MGAGIDNPEFGFSSGTVSRAIKWVGDKVKCVIVRTNPTPVQRLSQGKFRSGHNPGL